MNGLPGNLSTVLLITADGMGSAQPELRQKLIQIYLTLLVENGYYPAAICFYGEGVRLVVQGSPVLDKLSQLEAKGVRLVSCQTCLRYLGILEKVEVGIVGAMHDILEIQCLAQKVITL